MFYYLLYNSSFTFIVENRLFSTVLYGSILYIITHAILNYCDASILSIINNYYWTLFVLDIISICYAIYNSIMNNENFNGNVNGNGNTQTGNELNVSFNLLKNKINTMLDRKNDLTVTHIPVSNSNNQQMQNSQINSHQNYQQNAQQNSQQNTQKTNKFSTPISQLQNKNNRNLQSLQSSQSLNSSSTPISLIRDKINIVEPNINDDFIFDNGNSNGNESVAGSDVGSVMDLEDFESSL